MSGGEWKRWRLSCAACAPSRLLSTHRLGLRDEVQRGAHSDLEITEYAVAHLHLHHFPGARLPWNCFTGHR